MVQNFDQQFECWLCWFSGLCLLDVLYIHCWLRTYLPFDLEEYVGPHPFLSIKGQDAQLQLLTLVHTGVTCPWERVNDWSSIRSPWYYILVSTQPHSLTSQPTSTRGGEGLVNWVYDYCPVALDTVARSEDSIQSWYVAFPVQKWDGLRDSNSHCQAIPPTDYSGRFTHDVWADKSDISYLKTSWAFKHSDPLKSSPGSHSQFVSDSVGIISSCLLLAFPFLVSFALSHLRCLCFSVS